MKLYLKHSLYLCCCLISFLGNAANEKTRSSKQVDVKCYVELIGGGETVAFWNIPENQITKLAQRIHGQKVKSPEYGKKQNIYKVHECVLLNDDFSTEKAKQVDEKTAK